MCVTVANRGYQPFERGSRPAAKSALRSLVQTAANGGFEPKLTDAARNTNVCLDLITRCVSIIKTDHNIPGLVTCIHKFVRLHDLVERVASVYHGSQSAGLDQLGDFY
jgi:hypothetical protein